MIIDGVKNGIIPVEVGENFVADVRDAESPINEPSSADLDDYDWESPILKMM